MGREVRKVPKDWEHPKNWSGRYKPLSGGKFNSYTMAVENFKKDIEQIGLMEAVEDWGGGPLRDEYMPEWPKEEMTHYMMYEDTSEGTPISPAFETREKLAQWLADTGASAFGKSGASYAAWLATIKVGYALSAVLQPGAGVTSGVEEMHRIAQDD